MSAIADSQRTYLTHMPHPPELEAIPTAGSLVGRHLIVREISRGTIGPLFLARTQNDAEAVDTLARVIPIPVDLPPKDDQLIAEAIWDSANVGHDMVLRVADVVAGKGWVTLIHDYQSGTLLSSMHWRASDLGNPFPSDVAARIALDVLEGLEQSHGLCESNRIPWRPGSIAIGSLYLCGDGRTRALDGQVMAAVMRSARMRSLAGVTAGLAPEMADESREPDQRTDVFAVGAILWQLLTGRELTNADATAVESVAGAAPQGTVVPLGLQSAVQQALEINPDKRQSTLRELAVALVMGAEKVATYQQVVDFAGTLMPFEMAFRTKVTEPTISPTTTAAQTVSATETLSAQTGFIATPQRTAAPAQTGLIATPEPAAIPAQTGSIATPQPTAAEDSLKTTTIAEPSSIASLAEATRPTPVAAVRESSTPEPLAQDETAHPPIASFTEATRPTPVVALREGFNAELLTSDQATHPQEVHAHAAAVGASPANATDAVANPPVDVAQGIARQTSKATGAKLEQIDWPDEDAPAPTEPLKKSNGKSALVASLTVTEPQNRGVEVSPVIELNASSKQSEPISARTARRDTARPPAQPTKSSHSAGHGTPRASSRPAASKPVQAVAPVEKVSAPEEPAPRRSSGGLQISPTTLILGFSTTVLAVVLIMILLQQKPGPSAPPLNTVTSQFAATATAMAPHEALEAKPAPTQDSAGPTASATPPTLGKATHEVQTATVETRVDRPKRSSKPSTKREEGPPDNAKTSKKPGQFVPDEI